jgi:hypothetical protein
MSVAPPKRAKRHPFALVALFVLLLAAQSLLIIHRIEHAGVGGGIDCALCLAADHQSGAAPVLTLTLVPPLADTVAAVPVAAPASVPRLPYRSRAPPRTLAT